MGQNSKIEWTHHTFNAWRGCTKVSDGCKHCYADTMSGRNPLTLGVWGLNGTRVVAAETYWREPIKWDAAAKAAGQRHRVFCLSLGDVFEDWRGNMRRGVIEGDEIHPSINAVLWHRDDIGICDAGQTTVNQCRGERLATMADVRRRLGKAIDATPNLDWLLVTKRPENIRRMWIELFGDMVPRSNVWLLTSVENQEAADKRIPELLLCRDLVPVLGLSMEPLPGPVDLTRIRPPGVTWMDCLEGREHVGRSVMTGGSRINWVIVGGESGGPARPMHPDWARSIRDQCVSAGVAFHFKQWGEWAPEDQEDACPQGFVGDTCAVGSDGNLSLAIRKTKKYAGRLLDGRTWDGFPEVAHA